MDVIRSVVALDGKKSDINHGSRLLRSWKQISTYMTLGVRTVQRYETKMGLPIHRPRVGGRYAVWAFSEELDAWLKRPESKVTHAQSFEALKVSDATNSHATSGTVSNET